MNTVEQIDPTPDAPTAKRRAKSQREIDQAPRPLRPATKLDRKKAVALADKGVSVVDIAKRQGVNKSTVWSYLEKVKVQRKGIDTFRNLRDDCLTNLQAKGLEVQEKIIESLNDEERIRLMTPDAKAKALNNVTGTAYDKSRLERGQSTQNIASLTKILEQVHYKAKFAASKAEAKPTEPPPAQDSA